MGLLRSMMPPKSQQLAVVVFVMAMLFLENQIQKLEESRSKLGKAGNPPDPARPGARERERGGGRASPSGRLGIWSDWVGGGCACPPRRSQLAK